MQSIRVLSSNYEDFEDVNKQYYDKLKKIHELSGECWISGLECHTIFQDELATNFLDVYLKNSLKPEEKLNQLATAMCIELYSINIFKSLVTINLKWHNSFVSVRNSAFTEVINFHTMSYNPNKLKTTEGIAFYFQNYEILIKKRLPTIEEMLELKNISENAESEEVRKCAEWVINLVIQNREFEEYKKASNVASSLLIFINKTLKINSDFRINCFGISQFRTNIINLINKNYLADLRNAQDGIIVDESGDFSKKISMILQEINNRESTLIQHSELFDKIINRITIIRNNAKNRLEFVKKFEILAFDVSSVIPFSLKEYQKYMQETFQSQFPKTEKVDPIVKPLSITKKNIKPAQKPAQKKKVAQKQIRTIQQQTTFQKNEFKLNNLESDQPVDTMKKGVSSNISSYSEKVAVSTIAISQTKIEDVSRNATTSKAPLFQYANRVKEWFKAEPSHLKNETYLNLCEEEKFKQKVYHGFSLKVDEFIKDYSFEAEWDNSQTHSKDRLFCIPGEIQFKNANERGLFTFCQNVSGIVYHRHFTKKATEDLIQYANPSFRKVDFPSLEQSMLMENDEFTPISMLNDKDDLIEYQKFTDLLRITDRRHGVQLVLYKTQR